MTTTDILSSIPFRTDDKEVKWFYENETTVITYPKKFGRIEKWLQNRIGGPEEVRRPLDKYSSYIWKICDGLNTVDHIISTIRNDYKLERKEAEVSTLTYLKQLTEKGLIGLAVAKRKGE